MTRMVSVAIALVGSVLSMVTQAQDSAVEFWNAYDATAAPLQVEVVKEWSDEAGSYQLSATVWGLCMGPINRHHP